MKAAIVIDNWKLPIFERHLEEAGYFYTQGNGLTEDTLNLYVLTNDDPRKLEVVVRAANDEAARSKP